MVDKKVIILQEIDITPLIKAQHTLAEGLKKVHHDTLYRDGVIQRFEYSFELAWKTLKRILYHKGITVNNPRDTFREAAINGLIDDTNLWFSFLESRNETTHTYNEVIAERIYAEIPSFNTELQKLINHIVAL